MISNFPSKKAYNQGGYLQFEFIPHHQLASYPMISNGAALVPVGLQFGASWLKGYATKETLTYKEEPQFDANGTYYIQTISGFVPGDQEELISIMQSMAGSRYLVKLKDMFGRTILIGSPIAPLDFMAEYNSGSARSDQKGFSFTFTGTSIYRSPAYNV